MQCPPPAPVPVDGFFADLQTTEAVALGSTVYLAPWVSNSSVPGEWASADFNATLGQFTAGSTGVYAVKATVEIQNASGSPAGNPLNALSPTDSIIAQIFIHTADNIDHASGALAVSPIYQQITYAPYPVSALSSFISVPNGPSTYSLIIGADLQLSQGDILKLAVINNASFPVNVLATNTLWSVHRVK